MGYIYPKRVASSSESAQRPTKRHCTDKGKQPVQVTFSTEAGAAIPPEPPTIPVLPPGFPSPPQGYEELFEAWGDRWRESHGAAKAIGKLQERLVEFRDAAEVLQNTNLIPQHNLTTNLMPQHNIIIKLRHCIASAEEKLIDEDFAVHMDGKQHNPARIKELEGLIDRFKTKLAEKEKETKLAEKKRELSEARCAIQELLGTSNSSGVKLIGTSLTSPLELLRVDKHKKPSLHSVSESGEPPPPPIHQRRT
ncbi:hypothetical protein COEREDRAFT_11113 [Coemansia reversa NRRL 1564]|uniref:Uncharacterized protein n=1 Tax=Coemansia reversa (strain ATCC 12441 / NRRL 1564) TaxID=763665 RepID=A0A2G5B3X8_COERN|nr:hypothetical protein COEREDRAFT_11113 [Coemansia reversa NRRL 1564]|eukprot:PIA13709.1 hypothetical protein COEREDRAFT_11113 [Coemansia reversa NRRL 1564]